MIHYGDVQKINGAKVPMVDVITFGAPCQDLSVAGKRAGMKNVAMGDDETTRSGLFFEAIRIIKEMRDESFRQLSMRGTDVDIRLIKPRYAVYENVPGSFSSNKGEDFRAVLEETAKVAKGDACIPGPPGGKWPSAGCIMGDGWSIAWRVHDAQFWGVPQRRKRISLVADFGGSTAPEILFERKSVSRDTEESGKEGKDAATDVRLCIEETGRAMVLNDQGGSQMSVSDDVSGTLHAHEHGHQSVVYGISAYESNAMKSGNPNSGIYEAETARTLDLNGGSPACNQGGMAVVCLEGNGSRPSHKGDGYAESDTMYTLNSTEHHAVCIENHPADSRVKISEDGMVQTLSSRMGTGGGNVPMVMYPEKTTGSLMASGYDKLGTQEALNDMYVVESSAWDGGQVSPTLTANNAGGSQRMPDKDNFNTVIQSINGDIAGTLDASYYKGCGERQGVEREVVAYGLDRSSYNQGMNAKYDFAVDEEKIGTQVAKGPGAVCAAVDCRNATENEMNGSLQAKASNNLNSNNVCWVKSVVRRLTPLECERLQGFPDHWTDIGDWVDSKGKLHKGESDSPRYKALGNSIALPFWQWMAERMVKYLKPGCTMASLFDGIGGFPLVYSRCGCKPVWASEIEEFPIAVTKKHFPDNV